MGIGALFGREWEAMARGLEEGYRILGLALLGFLAGYFAWKLTRRCRYGAPPRSPKLSSDSAAAQTEKLAMRARGTS